MLQQAIAELEIVLSRLMDLQDLELVYNDSLKAERVSFSP